MGLRFRKSKKIGPFRVTLSKSGISTSVGVKGFRVTKTASGRVRTTATLPGTGISYVKETGTRNAVPGKAQMPAKAVDPPEARQPNKAKTVPLIGILILLICVI